MKIFYSKPIRRILRVVSTALLAALLGCSNHSSGLASNANQASKAEQGLPATGKVIDAIQAGGYTYMELSNNNNRFWVAAKLVRVQPNDTVSWDSATTVTNYTSFALNREFSKIYFVKNIRVAQ